MKKISGLLTGVVLFLAGAALIGGGIYFLIDKIEFYTHSVQTEGEVVDVETSRHKNNTYYRPVVSFQAVDGNTYTFTSETSTSAAYDFNKGDKLTVRYIEDKPQMAKVDSFLELWALPMALLVAGIVILLAGGGTVYNYFNKIKLRKELPSTGTLLKLAGRVEQKSSKNKTEFVIISDWLNPADSKMYAFTSDTISFDPTTYIKDRLMHVWISPMSPKKKHYMDISFLPEEA